jgi:hypothetical protein
MYYLFNSNKQETTGQEEAECGNTNITTHLLLQMDPTNGF